MSFETIKQQHDNALMPTYGRFPVALKGGKNATAYDEDGKCYIDFGSGIGVTSLGYCDEGYIKAVTEQLHTAQHFSNLYYNQTQIDCAQSLCERTGMARVFFGNSGAEANECAIKLARKYSFDKYGKGRSTVITLCNSFHGRTVTTLAATGQDVFHNYFFPFTGDFVYAPANDLEALKTFDDGTVCAVMLECVQGEGGVLPLETDYLRAVRRLCDEHDWVMIVDEVQTGIGRTGKLLAIEHADVKPDVVTLAKGLGGGLPIGACLCAERFSDVMSAGMHGSTFGGNPVVCAGASYVLSVVDTPEFLADVRRKGEYITARLQAMPHVKAVRGRGMMLGVVLEDDIAAKDVVNACLENGLLILTAKTLLRLLPPLSISQEELDRGLTILETVLKEWN
ncbi:MAG: aspartate aminotransferase family protein [Clostridia bacterium]|nr:aspartate aminotransferase family protein [Clostridia bacterium]